MYLHRHIEKPLLEAIKQFPVLALHGPRQTGKSTLLKQLFAQTYDYITMDDLGLRAQAQRDPQSFLRNYDRPLIVDEAQTTPQLLPEIKRRVDASGQPGLYILSGSQPFHLMRNLQESLAGRVLLLDLGPLTIPERLGQGSNPHWFTRLLQHGSAEKRDSASAITLESAIRQGGLPGLLTKTEAFTGAFFDSYLRTYVERDIPLLVQLQDGSRLVEFMQLLAPLSAREINKSQLGRDIGMSSPSANRWLQALESSGIWHSFPAFHGNLIKRIGRTPKGMLFDTGLICHLLQINTRESLLTHPFLGFIFETAVFNEIKTALSAALLPARLYHWRAGQREVDVVIEYGGRLFAFECKWNARLRGDEHKDLLRFRADYGQRVALCAVITSTGHYGELEKGVFQIPWLPV